MARETACQTEVVTLPAWIRLLPLGRVELVDSRQPFEVDQESLAAMVADFEGRGVDLVIDYEHQSLKGERAPAAGWIKHLEARPDGLWAQVEWTPQAQEYLSRREYRYFSPVLRLDPETRKPTVLMQVGLTNVPAIKHLPPLVAKCGGQRLAAGRIRGEREEKEKMIEQVKCLVGLNREAEDGVVWGKVLEVFGDLAAALKLPGDASASQVKGAVEALKAGKISPAQKGWAQEYFRQDPEGFRTYVAKAPKLVPTGEEFRLIGKDRQEGGDLLPEEMAICRSLNLSPEEYLKAKAQTGSAQ